MAQDHTDQPFQSGLRLPEKTRRDPKYDAARLMRKPAWYTCPSCRETGRFRLLVESSPEGDGLVQFHCSCGSMAPVMALGQPQVTDFIARNLGLTVSSPIRPMEYDLDLDY